MVSPLLAHAWSTAIQYFWRTGVERGSMDAGKPLYLLDLAPGDGRLAWLTLNWFRRQRETGTAVPKLCYLACGSEIDALDALARHPQFADHISSGWFDTVSHEAGKEQALGLRAQGISLLRTDNPVVLLCANWFQALPSALYGVHAGCVMEGLVVRTPSDNGCSRLDYEWKSVDENAPEHAALKPAFARYRAHLTSAPLLMPVQACAAIDALAQLSKGRYLLLAADPGSCTERQLRMGALTPPATWRPAVPPPVNYHAIAEHQAHAGALTWNHQLRDGGVVLHASWRDDHGGTAAPAFAAITACLDRAHPDDNGVLAADVAQTTSTAKLSLLRLSHYDPELLKHMVDDLLAEAAVLRGAAFDAWREALARTWANYLLPARDDAFCRDIGLLALHLGDFGLAMDCFNTALAHFGDNDADLHCLAYGNAAIGNLPAAIDAISQALEFEPDNADCLHFRAELERRCAHQRGKPWYEPACARQGALALEPLDMQHASGFLQQYRDVQIRVMTRLPDLNTTEQVQYWIESENETPGRISYAVMHQSHGFVGIVSLLCDGDAGYFYFWIGADFQNRGFGKQAMQLLITQMTAFGLDSLFSSAYVYNNRSRKALRALGFGELPLRAHAPDDEVVFLYRPLQAASLADPAARMRSLCTAIDSPTQFY
jgi:RimJ/RimL family protein N-acetyltransferase